MSRIDDVSKIIAAAMTPQFVWPANLEHEAEAIAIAIAAAGHLMPDLPEPDVITPRTEFTPDPIGLWNTDNPPVTGSPSNPPVVFVDENTDLPPTEARAYAYAILAAADYAERNQE